MHVARSLLLTNERTAVVYARNSALLALHAVPGSRFTSTRQLQAAANEQQSETQRSSDPLAFLVDQARKAPVVQFSLPTTAKPLLSPQQAHAADTSQKDASGLKQNVYTLRSGATAAGHPFVGPARATQQQMQQQSLAMPHKKLRPSRMDFETMYQQLWHWKQLYMTAHVPRFCFDAPELGAWVRYMRKQHKEQQLEQWKVDRLNALSFEWELTDQDAKWHHLYHQLRRYKLLHGTPQVDPSHSSSDQCDWMAVVRWLNQQARLLAKQKLSGHKKTMLTQLGVTLRLPKRLLHRTAQLQALNGMERRKLRKKWKKLDAAAAEQAWEQREREWQERREQQRQQQQVVQRRAELLQDAQAEVGGAGGAASMLLLLQQQQQHEERQQQQHQPSPPIAYAQPARGQAARGQAANLISSSSSSGSVMRANRPTAGPSAQQLQQQQQDKPEVPFSVHHPSEEQQAATYTVQAAAVASAAAAAVNARDETGALEGALEQGQQPAVHPAVDPAPQQQQPGLFYQRNRRAKKVKQHSRQEKWLAAQQQGQ